MRDRAAGALTGACAQPRGTPPSRQPGIAVRPRTLVDATPSRRAPLPRDGKDRVLRAIRWLADTESDDKSLAEIGDVYDLKV